MSIVFSVIDCNKIFTLLLLKIFFEKIKDLPMIMPRANMPLVLMIIKIMIIMIK